MNLPRLHAEPSRRHARRWLRRVARLVGPGFHPETPPTDYVLPSGEHSFTPRQARLFAYDLQRAEGLLGVPSFETISQTVHWQCMRVRYDPVTEQLIQING